MRSKVIARALALLLLAPLRASAEGSPEERARAKELIAQGARSYEGGDFARAAGEFRQAYELFHSPKIFFNIAQAELKAKHPDAAADAFAQFLTQTALDTKLDTSKVAEAKKELAGLRKKLAWTALSVEPEGARITVDGRPVLPGEVYLTLEPRKHLFSASAAGYQDVTRDVEVIGTGKQAPVTLELRPTPKVVLVPAQPQPQPAKPPEPAKPPVAVAPPNKEVPLVRPTEEPKPAPKPEAKPEAKPAEEGGTRTLLASADPEHKPAAGGLTGVEKPPAGGGVGHLPAYAAWGVAAVTAATAVGTGVYSLSLSNKAKNAEACAGDGYNGCYKTWKRVALTTDILWGVAGAAAVTGGVLFFVTSGSDGAGGEVGLRGSF